MRRKFLALTLVVMLLSLFPVSCSSAPQDEGNIALIRLNGGIAETSSQFGFSTSGITPKKVRDYLEKAKEDGAIKGVVLRVNSPGGTAAASQEIAGMIRRLEKPVVVSMADTAASGGYYISTYADWIVAQPGTATGSIGVIAQFMDVSGLCDKLGLNPQIIKSGKHKDMSHGVRPLTDEEKRIMQDFCDDAYEDFVKAVADGRGLDIERVRELATGQIYTGERAKELGLVDELGGVETAKTKVAELADITSPKLVEYKPPAPWWQEFIPGFLAKTDSDNLKLSEEQQLYLRLIKALEGWNGVPRYQVP